MTIHREGAAISRLVRERANLQRYLNELFEAPTDQAPRLERQTLAVLLGILGVHVSPDSLEPLALDPAEISRALAALPPAEGHVLREALRRIGAQAR